MGTRPGPLACAGPELQNRYVILSVAVFFSNGANMRFPLVTQNTKGIKLQGASPPEPPPGALPLDRR